MSEADQRLVPEQGWHCIHLFYRIEFAQWQLLSGDEQRAGKTRLAELVQEVRAIDSTQLLTLSMVTPKADIGFMLITPDLHDANRIEKQLSLALGADVLVPVRFHPLVKRRHRLLELVRVARDLLFVLKNRGVFLRACAVFALLG